MSWPEKDLELAEAMWFEGYFARRIADRIGVSRNAVIGMAYRRKWPRGELSEKLKAEAARVREAAQAKSRERKLAGQREKRLAAKEEIDMSDLLVEAPAPDPGGGSYTLLALPKNGCKWPLSGEKDQTLFCGLKQRRDGGPYCPEHHRRSYAPTRGHVDRPYKELAIL